MHDGPGLARHLTHTRSLYGNCRLVGETDESSCARESSPVGRVIELGMPHLACFMQADYEDESRHLGMVAAWPCLSVPHRFARPTSNLPRCGVRKSVSDCGVSRYLSPEDMDLSFLSAMLWQVMITGSITSGVSDCIDSSLDHL